MTHSTSTPGVAAAGSAAAAASAARSIDAEHGPGAFDNEESGNAEIDGGAEEVRCADVSLRLPLPPAPHQRPYKVLGIRMSPEASLTD